MCIIILCHVDHLIKRYANIIDFFMTKLQKLLFSYLTNSFLIKKNLADRELFFNMICLQQVIQNRFGQKNRSLLRYCFAKMLVKLDTDDEGSTNSTRVRLTCVSSEISLSLIREEDSDEVRNLVRDEIQ